MRVLHAFLCRYADRDNSRGTVTACGIFNAIRSMPTALPGDPITHGHSFIVALIGAMAADEGQHPAVVRLIDQDGQELVRVDGVVVVGKNTWPGYEQTSDWIIELEGIRLPKPGIYVFEFWVRGERLASINLYAVAPNEQGVLTPE